MNAQKFLILVLFSALASMPRMRADSIVTDWSNATLQAIRVSKIGPPMVARALAIVNTCVYDAWAAYDPFAVGTQLGGALRRPAAEQTEANKEKAISFAAYHALVDLFGPQKAYFDALMISFGYDPTDNSTDTTTPVGIGNVCSAAIISGSSRRWGQPARRFASRCF